MKTFLTTGGRELHDPDKEREHGPSNDLEHFYNEASTEKVYLSTDEREEFESERGIPLDADVLPDGVFDQLTTWLIANCDLIESGKEPVPPARKVNIFVEGGVVTAVFVQDGEPLDVNVFDLDGDFHDENEEKQNEMEQSKEFTAVHP